MRRARRDSAAAQGAPPRERGAPPASDAPCGSDAPIAGCAPSQGGRGVGRWRRRLVRVFVVLVIVVLVVRAALPFAAPRALAAWAEANGLAARYESLDLSLLTGHVELWHLELRDRERPAPEAPLLHVEYATLDLDVSSLLFGRPRLRRLEIDGLDLELRRRADGTLDLPFGSGGAAASDGGVVAGAGVAQGEQQAGDAEQGEESAQRADAMPTSLRLPVELSALRVQAVRVHLVDESVEPRIDANLELELRLSDLGADERPARLELAVTSPGIVDHLSVRALATTTAERVDARLDFALLGLHPHALAGILEPLGLQPTAETIEMRWAAHATLTAASESDPQLRATLAVRDVALTPEGGLAANLDSTFEPNGAFAEPSGAIETIDVSLALGVGEVVVEEVVVRGLRGRAARLADGRFVTAGFVLGGAKTTPAAESEPAATATASPPALQVDSARIEDARFDFVDAAAAPESVRLELVIARIAVSNLVIDPRRPGERGSFEGELAVPGVAGKIDLSGTFVPDPNTIAANLELEVSALAPERLAPYLAAAGLESTFADGSLSARLSAGAILEDGGLRDGRVALVDVRLRDGERELFGLAEARVDAIALAPLDSRVGSVRIRGIDLPLARDAEGALEFLGLRTRTAADATPPDARAGAGPADDARAPSAPIASPSSSGAAGRFELGRFELSETSIRFEDQSVLPHLALAADELEAELEGLVLGASSSPARLSARLSVDGVVDELALLGTLVPGASAPDLALDLAVRGSGFSTVGLHPLVDVLGLESVLQGALLALDLDLDLAQRDGGLALDPLTFGLRLTSGDTFDELSLEGEAFVRPEESGVSARVELNGIRSGELAALLPPGIELAVTDGRLAAALAAGSTACPEGGRSAWFELSDLAYRDGERPLAALGTLAVRASRLDPAAGVFAFDEVALRGLELEVFRTEPGRLELLGLAFAEPPAAPEEHGVDAAVVTEPPARTSGGATPNANAALPLVTLAKLDVGIARFAFLDTTQAGARPLDASLRLSNTAPLVLLDAHPDALPPIELALTGSAEPVLGELEIGIGIEPFATRPEIVVSIAAAHIRGGGLTEVLPELVSVLDGSGLVDGRFDASVRGALDWRRRGPTDFDVSSGFGAELELRDVAFRAEPEGPVLVGVDGVDVSVARIDPATGAVHVSSVEIETPRLHARRDADGLHVAGIVVLPAQADTGAVDVPAGASTRSPEPAVAAVEAASSKGERPSAPAAPEFRLDDLSIQGLDVEFRDASAEPELFLPLEDLSLEVKDFSTLAFSQQKHVRYSAYLRSGRVPLPIRRQRSLLGGLAHGALGMAGLGKEQDERTEERAFFDEIAVTGSLAFHPALEGWTKIEVSSLELLGFEGAAREGGVTIGDGVLDASVYVRFRGERGASTVSSFDFQHLALSEPANGPISRYLKLPMPLDAVLFVLRNSEGAHVVPLSFDTTTSGGMGGGALAAAAATTFAKVVAEAVAQSPLRVTGKLTDFVGLTGRPPEDLSQEGVSFAFEAADPAFDSTELGRVKGLLTKVKADDELGLVLTHSIGQLDVERASVFANPSPEACVHLSLELRAKKRDLGGLREDVAARARAHYAVGNEAAAAAATERLRAIERELSRTEDALDRLGDLLRSGADRRRDKRTRAACLEIAERRLETVRAALLEDGVHPGRLEVRRPRFVLDDTTPANGQVILVPKRR